ncbi:putative AC transposase [Tanacetum coccineum]
MLSSYLRKQEVQRDESKGDYVVYALSSKIMAPVFSRDAYRCVWHVIQVGAIGLGHPVSTEPVQLSQILPVLGTVSSGLAIHNGPAFHQESLAFQRHWSGRQRHRTLNRNTWTVSIFPPWVAFISLSSLESQLRLSFEIEKKLRKKRRWKLMLCVGKTKKYWIWNDSLLLGVDVLLLPLSARASFKVLSRKAFYEGMGMRTSVGGEDYTGVPWVLINPGGIFQVYIGMEGAESLVSDLVICDNCSLEKTGKLTFVDFSCAKTVTVNRP